MSDQAQTIAIDAMSGDAGASIIVKAALQVKEAHPHLRLLLVGREAQLRKELDRHSRRRGRKHGGTAGVDISPANDVVAMGDSAAVALRSKKQSSMRIAIDQVKSGLAGAVVSAGNTGALMAISKFVLKTLPGIDRPAISTTIPAIDGHTHMLDLGANVDCTAEHLLQFAVMGSILTQAVDGIAAPRIALLNIGSEDIKGNEQVKQAALLLEASDLNYIGFAEGDQIYTRHADVVVCDGFVGNVSLKTSEGVARMVSHYLKQEFTGNWRSKLIGAIARPVLKSFGNRIDPRRYNGASLLGLTGVVIKSHGSADALAFANAINIARVEIEKNLPVTIGEHVQHSLSQVS